MADSGYQPAVPGSNGNGKLEDFPIRTGQTETVTPFSAPAFNIGGVHVGGHPGFGGLEPTNPDGSADNATVHPSPYQRPVTKSPKQLEAELKAMPADQVRALQQRLIAAGFTDIEVNGHADPATIKAYDEITMQVAQEQQADPNSKSTFDSVLKDVTDAYQADPNNKKKSAYNGPVTTTETDKKTSLDDPQDARAIIATAIETNLGRKATDKDIAAFTSALQQYQQMHPAVTTSTTYTDNGNPGNAPGGGDPSQVHNNVTSNTQQPVTDSAFAQNYLDDHYQAEQQGINQMNYFNWALGMLSQPGNTGH